MHAESFRTSPLRPREWIEWCAESEVAEHGGSDSATTLISPPVLVRTPETHTSGSNESGIAVPPVLQGLPLLAARLRQRHPGASPAMVQDSIDDAIRSFDDARVRIYLPILVERSASDSLRRATHSSDPVAAPERGSI